MQPWLVIKIVPHERWQSDICQRCVTPGHCCTGFNLSNSEHPLVFWDDEPIPDKPPFVPTQRWGQWTAESGADAGRTYSAWDWRCTLLRSDGRCGDYENRPQLCRDYVPLTDHLCIMKKKEQS